MQDNGNGGENFGDNFGVNGGENFGGKINVSKDRQKLTDTRQKYPFTSQLLFHLQ